jgi:hypothetical protein
VHAESRRAATATNAARAVAAPLTPRPPRAGADSGRAPSGAVTAPVPIPAAARRTPPPPP